jgi:hypothetical protein
VSSSPPAVVLQAFPVVIPKVTSRSRLGGRPPTAGRPLLALVCARGRPPAAIRGHPLGSRSRRCSHRRSPKGKVEILARLIHLTACTSLGIWLGSLRLVVKRT